MGCYEFRLKERERERERIASWEFLFDLIAYRAHLIGEKRGSESGRKKKSKKAVHQREINCSFTRRWSLIFSLFLSLSLSRARARANDRSLRRTMRNSASKLFKVISARVESEEGDAACQLESMNTKGVSVIHGKGLA